jgi:hypothetical protein
MGGEIEEPDSTNYESYQNNIVEIETPEFDKTYWFKNGFDRDDLIGKFKGYGVGVNSYIIYVQHTLHNGEPKLEKLNKFDYKIYKLPAMMPMSAEERSEGGSRKRRQTRKQSRRRTRTRKQSRRTRTRRSRWH